MDVFLWIAPLCILYDVSKCSAHTSDKLSVMYSTSYYYVCNDYTNVDKYFRLYNDVQKSEGIKLVHFRDGLWEHKTISKLKLIVDDIISIP